MVEKERIKKFIISYGGQQGEIKKIKLILNFRHECERGIKVIITELKGIFENSRSKSMGQKSQSKSTYYEKS